MWLIWGIFLCDGMSIFQFVVEIKEGDVRAMY